MLNSLNRKIDKMYTKLKQNTIIVINNNYYNKKYIN